MEGKSSATFVVVTLVAIALGAATSWPFGLLSLAATSFAVNYVAFIPAVVLNTEIFFDLTGAITNTTLAVYALYLVNVREGPLTTRRLLCCGLIVVWALRLGSYLFTRILADGEDKRFRSIKKSKVRFFNVWSLQALWCWFNVIAYAILTSKGLDDAANSPLAVLDYVGLAMWLAGFVLEVTADTQKSAFRKNPDNKGRFISTGVWAWSRHPNYVGEIILWAGVATICSSAFAQVGFGLHWLGLWSPAFVTLLLTKVSGVPMLEASADKRWGDDAEYKAYKARTPCMFPLIS